MTELSYRPLRYRDRWFAYIDLLGFTALVQSHAIERVLPVYADALKQMKAASNQGKKRVGLLNSWFSDTFIIYSRGDSLEDFAHLESAARIFFQLLTVRRIPARGCISFGKLYSQAKENVFIGPALIEAHQFGEELNWIGLCMAPSVEARLKSSLPLSRRAHYRLIQDPAVLRRCASTPVYAFAFNNGSVNRQNPYRLALEEMRSTAPKQALEKYDNSLAFLGRCA